jgi:5'-nucleotidase
VRVLLTNDDGVRSAGIQAIRAALAPVCTSVVTVAPDGERSGFARKCTFDRPVRVRRLEGGRNPVYECDGTPTDCVRAGLLGGLATDADPAHWS